MNDYLKINKEWWNKVTPIHANSKLYSMEAWQKGEKTDLMPLEIEEVGDVAGKTLLHLQCHMGMGSIDWAKKGAIVTGVDLSDESINLAKKLSEKVKIPTNFICSDIYDLPNILQEKFDIVFTSYGVLAWLPDLKKWASIVNHFLKDGGTFYIIELHPFTEIYDKDLHMTYSYFDKEPFIEESSGDYTDRNKIIKSKTYEWSHTMADIINSLIDEGLKIEYLHEFPFTVYEQFTGLMEQDPKGYFTFKDKKVQVPLLFSLKATK